MKNKPARTKNLSNNLITLVGVLLLFGVIFVYNATSVHSQRIYQDPNKFAVLHVAWVAVGLAGFFIFYKLNYKKISKASYIFFLVTLLFLGFLALISLMPCSLNLPFSPCINGANRWVFLNPPPLPPIPFLGVLGFQPSELAKFSLILYLSVQLALKAKKDDAFMIYLISTGLASFLILLQPNMSTCVLVFVIGSCIYFSSNFSLKPVLISLPVIIFLGFIFMFSSSYRKERLFTLLKGMSFDEESKSYHSRQVILALGSGGLFGKGFGNSIQKYMYLPEVASDSIFAVVGEEFGFLGTFILICAFGCFVYLGFSIALNATDNLGKYLSVGITSWIGFQFFVNVAAMAGIIPLTGMPMPLISYGGSSMVFSLMGLGLLANIAKEE